MRLRNVGARWERGCRSQVQILTAVGGLGPVVLGAQERSLAPLSTALSAGTRNRWADHTRVGRAESDQPNAAGDGLTGIAVRFRSNPVPKHRAGRILAGRSRPARDGLRRALALTDATPGGVCCDAVACDALSGCGRSFWQSRRRCDALRAETSSNIPGSAD